MSIQDRSPQRHEPNQFAVALYERNVLRGVDALLVFADERIEILAIKRSA
jgi:hypothetical protein